MAITRHPLVGDPPDKAAYEALGKTGPFSAYAAAATAYKRVVRDIEWLGVTEPTPRPETQADIAWLQGTGIDLETAQLLWDAGASGAFPDVRDYDKTGLWSTFRKHLNAWETSKAVHLGADTRVASDLTAEELITYAAMMVGAAAAVAGGAAAAGVAAGGAAGAGLGVGEILGLLGSAGAGAASGREGLDGLIGTFRDDEPEPPAPDANPPPSDDPGDEPPTDDDTDDDTDTDTDDDAASSTTKVAIVAGLIATTAAIAAAL